MTKNLAADSTQDPATVPIPVFLSYSHTDEVFRVQLEKHLTSLRREGEIASWSDRRIGPGDEWRTSIDASLEQAKLILLLVSADFLASEYCYGNEVRRAMDRHNAGAARVIPIILRPVDWKELPFAKLQALPRDAKPITTWPNIDDAFLDVVTGIRLAAEAIRTTGDVHPMHARITYSIEIAGHISEFDNQRLEAIVQQLRALSGDVTLTLKRMISGSVILELEGSTLGLVELTVMHESGELASALGVIVKSVSRDVKRKVVLPRTALHSHSRVRLYVGNLPFSADENQVRELFAGDGRLVTEVKLVTDPDTGRPRGFGFVEMENSEDAKSAIRELNGQEFGGRPLTVDEVRKEANRRGSS